MIVDRSWLVQNGGKGGRRPPFPPFCTNQDLSTNHHVRTVVPPSLLRAMRFVGSPKIQASRGRESKRGKNEQTGGRRPPVCSFLPLLPLAPSRPGFWGSRVRLPGQGRPRFLPPFSRSISGRKKRKKSHLHPKLLNQALLRGAGAPWAPVAGGPPRGLGGYPLTLLGLGQGSPIITLWQIGASGRPTDAPKPRFASRIVERVSIIRRSPIPIVPHPQRVYPSKAPWSVT